MHLILATLQFKSSPRFRGKVRLNLEIFHANLSGSIERKDQRISNEVPQSNQQPISNTRRISTKFIFNSFEKN